MYNSILNIQNHFNPKFIKGEGCYLYTEEGDRYIDFAENNGKNLLGYNSSILEKEVIKHLNNGFFYSSNYFASEEILDFKKMVCNLAGFVNEAGSRDGDVLFFSSTSEANECAMQIARNKYNIVNEKECNEIICFENDNNGSTIEAINSTNKNAVGFKLAKYNDIQSVKQLINNNTSAIMIEPLQLSHGLNVCDVDFLIELRQLCTDHKIALIINETNCGVGRTGTFFAFENYNIKPDIITVSGGISNVLPLGICIVNGEFAKFLPSHSPNQNAEFNVDFALSCSVCKQVYEEIATPKVLQNVKKVGNILTKKINTIYQDATICISNVICNGLIVNLKIDDDVKAEDVAVLLLKTGVISIVSNDNSLLFFPPLNITSQDADLFCDKLLTIFGGLSVIHKY